MENARKNSKHFYKTRTIIKADLLKNILKRFLLIFCASAIFILGGSYSAKSEDNLNISDVGDYGNWLTPNNQNVFKINLTSDINSFQDSFQRQILVKDFVPIEAKVGRALIGGLSKIGTVLENSLVRFMSIFIIILLIFWVSFQTYDMMQKGGDIKKLATDIVKKIILVVIWILILEQGPAQLFMFVMGPVLMVGTYLSNMILDSISGASGYAIPDTCAAIHNYIAANHTGNIMIDADATANILCTPTRLSGFFYTAVAAGWQWMISGIGTSVFTFVAGAIFVVLFIYNIWKFALMSLGVIADLFLIVLMLPFTAIAETFGTSGKTSYDGIAGNIFNQFVGLFNAQSLSSQIQKFINSMIYFVSLSIVIAICAALLSGVVSLDGFSKIPTIDDDGFMNILIVGCLVSYLATQAGKIAEGVGKKIDDRTGNQIEGDIKKLWGGAQKSVKSLIKIIRG